MFSDWLGNPQSFSKIKQSFWDLRVSKCKSGLKKKKNVGKDVEIDLEPSTQKINITDRGSPAGKLQGRDLLNF